MKILITGGHLAPALAVINKLLELDKKYNLKIVFVGRKNIPGNQSVSLEFQEIARRNISFIDLQAGRLTRLMTIQSILNLLKTPIGFIKSFFIILKEKPDAVLTFGGYLALPIAFTGYLFNIPVYTHEQTIRPGLTNMLIARLAKKIFVSFEETLKYFPRKKTFMTGDPIREKIFQIIIKPFNIVKNKPVIYICGGSLGSHSINLIIEKIIDQLLDKYIIIHQTGDVKQYADFEKLNLLRRKLPSSKRNNYFIKKHFLEEELGYIYSHCDLVVGRSGANTFFELIALKIPAIFIPLPWSAENEQIEQARIFQKFKTGEIFEQSDESEKLINLIDLTINKLGNYRNNFRNLSNLYKQDAASIIIGQILE